MCNQELKTLQSYHETGQRLLLLPRGCLRVDRAPFSASGEPRPHYPPAKIIRLGGAGMALSRNTKAE